MNIFCILFSTISYAERVAGNIKKSPARQLKTKEKRTCHAELTCLCQAPFATPVQVMSISEYRGKFRYIPTHAFQIELSDLRERKVIGKKINAGYFSRGGGCSLFWDVSRTREVGGF